MHINEKILEYIYQNNIFENDYSIHLPENDWDAFKQPIPNGLLGQTIQCRRQEDALKIIKVILDANGKSDILQFISELTTLEPKISPLQKFSRDHVVHALNTFLLGVYILDKVDFPIQYNQRLNFPFMWKLCGPTHDLGYATEISYNIGRPYYEKINEILDKLQSPSPRVVPHPYPEYLNEICRHRDSNQIIQTRFYDWNLDINVDEYYSWLIKNHKTDHGIISALTQMKVIDSLYFTANPEALHQYQPYNGFDFNQNNFDLDIVSACSAIFLHNIHHEYKGFTRKIDFQTAPIAFLLYLCDTFQEWDRFSQYRQIFSGKNFNIECTANSINLQVPKINLKVPTINLEEKMVCALHNRLAGLNITVNGNIAVNK